MHFIALRDYLLVPLYLFIIGFAAYRIRERYYPAPHPLRKYFLPGLAIKLLGGLCIALLYEYHYRSGDTFAYFRTANIINSSWADSPVKWWKLITVQASRTDPGFFHYMDAMNFYDGRCLNMYMVSIITALLNLVTFGSFLNTTLLFAAGAFTGIWALFRLFSRLYPALLPQLSVPVLFLPSVALWSSGIFKDSIALCCTCWIVFITFRVVLKRALSLGDLLLWLVCFVLLFLVKSYISIALLPPLGLLAIMHFTRNIPKPKQVLVRGGIICMAAVALILMSTVLSPLMGKYSLQRFIQTSDETRASIISQSRGQEAGYDLGQITPTAGGMLRKAPAAIIATLYRPYIWESQNVLMFLNALETTGFLLFSIWVIFATGARRLYRAVSEDLTIQFCLCFTLLFAFAIGVSTFNFGALSRYRVPCVPFFGIALVLIYFRERIKVVKPSPADMGPKVA